jgi:hypothetical protein
MKSFGIIIQPKCTLAITALASTMLVIPRNFGSLAPARMKSDPSL